MPIADQADMSSRATSAVVALCITISGCIGAVAIQHPTQPPSTAQMMELWTDPGSTPRDLFWGVGGQQYAPSPDAAYLFEKDESGGFSPGYDVKDPNGLGWSAKMGPEAQTEVVLSRVLWGLGYRQPPVYYLGSWTLDRGSKQTTEGPARFRPKLPSLERQQGEWQWQQNPFVGTHELSGLLVVMMMFTSTDLKNSNNTTYAVKPPWNSDGATRWFVVRDIGAALGETGKIGPKRNWVEGFEANGFITEIKGDRVEFDYHGLHRELISMIHPADVQWAGRLAQRLTDQQWHDAFRAAGYQDALADRFIRRIKEKIDDSIALRARPVN